MSYSTSIEWTDATLSPWIGCTRVSAGCANCYLVRTAPARVNHVELGVGKPRYRVKTFLEKAILLNRRAERTGRRIRVFPSQCDWLDAEVPLEWFEEFLSVLKATPWLDWQLLTKRPDQWHARLMTWASSQLDVMGCPKLATGGLYRWVIDWIQGTPPTNVWVGASIENQPTADGRMAALLSIPARIRFLSVEPFLGSVSLTSVDEDPTGTTDALRGATFCEGRNEPAEHARIHWVICGGESGPKARPMHPDWARSLRDQCAAAGVPFFFKQWGEWIPRSEMLRVGNEAAVLTMSRKSAVMRRDGGIDDRLGEAFLSNDSDSAVYWVGKKAAGRLLDGKEHNEFPEVHP